jgi:hypothetical protein
MKRPLQVLISAYASLLGGMSGIRVFAWFEDRCIQNCNYVFSTKNYLIVSIASAVIVYGATRVLTYFSAKKIK